MLMKQQEDKRNWLPRQVSAAYSSANTHRSEARGDYSFFKEMPEPEPCLAAFFSFSISFFCLFDLGAAFCTFFCSLFATITSFRF